VATAGERIDGGGPLLVLRADGGPGIGVGHLARSLALAQAWRDLRGRAVLRSRSIPETWRRRYERDDVAVVDAQDALGEDASWFAFDGYRLTSDDVEEVQATTGRVLVIDDHGRTKIADPDLLVDQNLSRLEPEPTGRARLLGPRYALIRRELRARLALSAGGEDQAPSDEHRSARLLVSMGGAPSEASRAFVAAVLADARLAHLDAAWLAQLDDVGSEFARATMALAAAGSTAWELCAFGVPAVLVAVADNQVQVGEALGRVGAARFIGTATNEQVGLAADTLADLIADPSGRAAMARVGRALVDGDGALRVATRMRAELLTLRPARPDDAELLWAWANDPQVRERSFSKAPIPWSDHLNWLASVLAGSTRTLFIAEDERGRPVGQIRFDLDDSSPNGTATIGVSIAAAHRGGGWAGALIDAGVRRFFAGHNVADVTAIVLEGNDRSARAFCAADFDRGPDGSDGGHRWSSFHRPRPRA